MLEILRIDPITKTVIESTLYDIYSYDDWEDEVAVK